MEIYFYFSLLIFSFFIYFNEAIGIVYYLQLDGYEVSSVLKSLKSFLKKHYLNIIIYTLLVVLFFNLQINSTFAMILILDIMMVFSVLTNSNDTLILKVKYTKRMCRLLAFTGVLGLVSIIVAIKFFSIEILSITFLLLSIFTYPVILLCLLIVSPIEKGIKRHYIKLATGKINERKNLLRVAVTGSYGKTSTKELIASILSTEYSVCATEQSFNTPMGISLTINNRLKNTHEILLCEMGAKNIGEIYELCDIVKPDIGIVVSVGRQHMETFGSIENIYKTKNELPKYHTCKRCVFNLDNKYVYNMFNEYSGDKIGVRVVRPKNKLVRSVKIKKNRRCLSGCVGFEKYYAFDKKHCIYAKNIDINCDKMEFDVYEHGERLFRCSSLLLGYHNITNILLAIAVGRFLGVKNANMNMAIRDVERINARLEKSTTASGSVVINNGYNSNITSATQTLAVLDLYRDKIKVVVTPGLVDCLNGEQDNIDFAKIISKYADKVVVVGDYNRKWLTIGLERSGFLRENIDYIDDFSGFYDKVCSDGGKFVYLIENDLPDNYR